MPASSCQGAAAMSDAWWSERLRRAPCQARNGNFKRGFWTTESKRERRETGAQVR